MGNQAGNSEYGGQSDESARRQEEMDMEPFWATPETGKLSKCPALIHPLSHIKPGESLPLNRERSAGNLHAPF